MERSTVVRIAISVAWMLLLDVWFRRWDATLRAPGLLVWTLVFVTVFLATAAARDGRRAWPPQPAVWQPSAVWLGLTLVAAGGYWVAPTVPIGGRPMSTAFFVGLLDLVVPLWIALRGLSLTWRPPARLYVLAGVPAVMAVYWMLVMIPMPGPAYAGPFVPLSASEDTMRARLETHVRVLADEIGARNDGAYAALDSAANYVDRVLESLGYIVRRQAFPIGPLTFYNLEATLTGQTNPDEVVVVGAHYDSTPDGPGANDNASGTAAVLEFARVLADDRLARTVRFVAFANEEPPYFNTDMMGSRIYARAASDAGIRIVAMVSMETVGYYSTEPGSQQYPFPFNLFYPDQGNFVGFVGNLASRDLVRRSVRVFREEVSFPSEGVAAPAWIRGVDWSDHASFWIHGYSAIMITDTAPFRYLEYHTPRDTADRLDYARMARVVAGVTNVIRDLAQPL